MAFTFAVFIFIWDGILSARPPKWSLHVCSDVNFCETLVSYISHCRYLMQTEYRNGNIILLSMQNISDKQYSLIDVDACAFAQTKQKHYVKFWSKRDACLGLMSSTVERLYCCAVLDLS